MDMQKVFFQEGKAAPVTGAAYGTGFVIAEALAKIVSKCSRQYMDGCGLAYIGKRPR